MKNYAAIILSAGYSSRMGEFKPLMNLNGKTPIERCISLFQNCGIKDIVVVTGHLNDKVEEKIKDINANEKLKNNLRIVQNNKYSEGMFSSIQTGLKILSPDIDAFFLLPVDIPSVKEGTVKKIMERYENIDNGILFPTFNKETGHPTIISCSVLDEILSKNPEGGLRDILNDHKDKWFYEELADRGILLDMDTKEDFKILYDHVIKEPYPDHEECMEILRLSNVKQEAIEHMLSVSEFSKKVAVLLNEKGYNLNINAAYSGGLLHDVGKGKKDHAKEGAKIVCCFGYKCLSEIVSEHMELINSNKIGEKEVVYICDKLLMGTELVSLNKRFEQAWSRYENSSDVLKNVNKRYEDAVEIKKKIEDVLGNSLENLR
ncbi:DVU_1551 family NTP transferase [Clostridium sp. C2-6-12]|uniref:DVU_1551 family NTP transferase n=1 Tax=Clostridium sp. C2-6-12 TaxID=2698832 RepID=UPI00136D91FF|nr:NTP transferase domain-containing protein [Clostridium sp. C2-6-12]